MKNVKHPVVFGMALTLAALTAQANDLEIKLSEFNRGNSEDVFRGAQLRVVAVLEFQDETGKVTKNKSLGQSEDVVIPDSSETSNETRDLLVSEYQVAKLLADAPNSTAFVKLVLRFVEVDWVKNDSLRNFELATARHSEKDPSKTAQLLLSQVGLKLANNTTFQDWEEIQTHYYEVSVPEYVTTTEWTYHYGFNLFNGKFEPHFGPHTVNKYVGSHMETRSFQTGGGTKASFKAEVTNERSK